MCNPTGMAAATGGLQAGGAILNYSAQRKSIEAQSRANAQAFDQTVASARDNLRRSEDIMARRNAQEIAATGQQTEQNAVAALRAKSGVAVRAAANGVSGSTMDILYADIDRNMTINRSVLRDNLNQRLQDNNDRLQEIFAQNQSRVNSALPPEMSGPSPFSLLLGLGSAAMNARRTYLELSRP